MPADHAGYYAKYFVNPIQWTPEEKLPEVAGKAYELSRGDWRLIHPRYQPGGCTNASRKPAISTVRRDACHREFYGQGGMFRPLRLFLTPPAGSSHSRVTRKGPATIPSTPTYRNPSPKVIDHSHGYAHRHTQSDESITLKSTR